MTDADRNEKHDTGPATRDVVVLPLRDGVLFPASVRPLAIPREIAAPALAEIEKTGYAAAFAQRSGDEVATTAAALHGTGVLVHVHQSAELPDGGHMLVVVHATERVRLDAELSSGKVIRARVTTLEDVGPAEHDPEIGPLSGSTRDLAVEMIASSPLLSNELMEPLVQIDRPGPLADFVAGILPSISVAVRQELLENVDAKARLRRVHEELVKEVDAIKMRRRLEAEVEQKMGKAQREFVLREQLRAIRRELGETSDVEKIVDDLKTRLDAAGLPEAVKAEADREVRRLAQLSGDSAEASVVRTYLDWLAALPWTKTTADEMDLDRAKRALDEDHHDLVNVKERILDYLAVHKLRHDLKAPLLCLAGPPGVGKTSIGKSIARASGRAFVRISLGGVRDEAEIRGHRRTYVGALPGQIIQGIRRAGTRDPVFMLDEIDKLGSDFRGDPASALMEVLDPEQNAAFRDHYLDVPFDLSGVLFITTANLLEAIPGALRDRMEVLPLPGYSDEDKLAIAKGFVVPRQIAENGLSTAGDRVTFADDALRTIIRSYTREAGVRNLERAIATVCRKEARVVASGGATGPVLVTPAIVRQRLGAPPFDVDEDFAARVASPGVAVALAWTPHGGDVLLVEAVRMPRDRGDVFLTGNMGEVMQESARAALSWLRANGWRYGVTPEAFARSDVHVHVPSGAAPKDGPSAGVVLVAALLGAFTGRAVRPRVAMTGEITLSGAVLPVGGIHEKVLAARRSGMREVVLPARSREVVEELAPEVRGDLAFVYVDTIEEAMLAAFGAVPAAATARTAVAAS